MFSFTQICSATYKWEMYRLVPTCTDAKKVMQMSQEMVKIGYIWQLFRLIFSDSFVVVVQMNIFYFFAFPKIGRTHQK